MHSSIKLSPIWRAFGKSFSPLHKSLFIIKFPSENAYQRPTLIWDTEPIFDVDRVVDGGKLLPTLELVYLKSKIPKCCLIQINLKWWLGQLVSVECSDWWLRPGPVCRGLCHCSVRRVCRETAATCSGGQLCRQLQSLLTHWEAGLLVSSSRSRSQWQNCGLTDDTHAGTQSSETKVVIQDTAKENEWNLPGVGI